jgi:hypothetical protein
MQTSYERIRTVNLEKLMLVIPLCLTACSTVPTAQRVVECPRLPAMEKTVVPEKSFTERMGLFLSGSLEKQTNSEPVSNNATVNTKPLEKP